MRWRTGLMLPVVTALLIAVLPEERAAGQQPRENKLDATAIDTLVNSTLRDVIQRGATIYNNGDFESAYHLYEGALIALKPLLGHRPALMREIDRALVSAERATEVQKRAWVLREVMDQVRNEVRGRGEVPMVTGPLASLKGKITVDGQPLLAGKVVLWGDKEQVAIGPVVKGTYQVEKIAPGDYVVVIVEDDAARGMIDPKFLLDRTTPLKLTVKDATPLQGDINLTSPAKVEVPKATGTIRGKVLVDGKPAAKAVVGVFPKGGGIRTAKVQEDGTYTVERVAPGAAKVTIVTPDEGPTIDPKYGSSGTTPLSIEVDLKELTNFDIELKTFKGEVPKNPEPAKEATVSGIVTLKGQPLAKGTVVLVSDKRESLSALIAEDGAYRFAKVPAGKYKVVVQSPDGQGKELLPERYSNGDKTLLMVEIVAPATTHDIKLN